jgi:type I restriction enzyme S subunit
MKQLSKKKTAPPIVVPPLTPVELTELPRLPANWQWIRLGHITLGVEYGTSSKSKPEGKIPVLRMGNIQNSSLDWSDLVYSDDDADNHKYMLKKNDVLFNRTNSPALVGKTAIYRGERPAIFAGYLIRINQIDELSDAKYLNYFLNSPIAKIVGNKVKSDGVNQSNINGTKLVNYPFPYCSIEEQRRIVEKIEELLSDLDNGIASLTTAQRQLKVYRQSVLKWAFEGKLTEAWRKTLMRDDPDLLDGENFLQQILEKRGEGLTTPSTQIDNSAPLAQGWCSAYIGNILQHIEAGKSFQCVERPPTMNEIGVAKVSAVTWGEYNEQESKTCVDKARIDQRLLITVGDFLFSRANTIELVGACVIAKQVKLRVMLSDKTLRFRFAEDFNSSFLLYFLRSRFGRQQIESLSTGNQESMRNIGQERIKRIELPFPGRLEQDRIVQEIERRLSVCDMLEATIVECFVRADALLQSILKLAFEGRLAPQSPDDESAEVLLRRITDQISINEAKPRSAKKQKRVRRTVPELAEARK